MCVCMNIQKTCFTCDAKSYVSFLNNNLSKFKILLISKFAIVYGQYCITNISTTVFDYSRNNLHL